MEPSECTLYYYDASPCSRRVELSLIELGLPYRKVPVNLTTGEQKTSAYLAIHPLGIVPAAAHDGHTLFESNVITEYLDRVAAAANKSSLYPQGAWERAVVKHIQLAELELAKVKRRYVYQRLFCVIIHTVHPTLDGYLDTIRKHTSSPEQLLFERRKWEMRVMEPDEEAIAEEEIRNCLRVMEKLVSSLWTGGPYILGKHVTQADISLYPRLRIVTAVGIAISAEEFPRLHEWLGNIWGHPSVDRTEDDVTKMMNALQKWGLLKFLTRYHKTSSPSLLDKFKYFCISRAMRAGIHLKQRQESAKLDAPEVRFQPPQTTASPTSIPTGIIRPKVSVNSAVVVHCAVLSPCSLRVLAILEYAGVPYTTKRVDLAAFEHRTPQFMEMNPLGLVPVLSHNERHIYDTSNISSYIDAVLCGQGCPSLFPDDAYGYAAVQMWYAWDGGLQRDWKPLWEETHLSKQVQKVDFSSLSTKQREASRRIASGMFGHETDSENSLKRVRGHLKYLQDKVPAAGGYLVGERLTCADFAVCSRLTTMGIIGIDLETEFPHLHGWFSKVGAHPAFKKAQTRLSKVA